MSQSTTISVIIPTYNRAELVSTAVDSLLAQTRIPEEIIVVDDGSTDDTPTVLQKYECPVQIIRQENGGLAAARNTGIKAATGDLIAFLDDDDTLTSNSIELRAQYLEEHPEVDVVYGDIMITDLDGVPQCLYSSLIRIKPPSGNVFGTIVQGNIAPIHAFMLRGYCFDKVGLFNGDYYGLEDYHLLIRLAQTFKFLFINEVVGFYRFHTSQMISNKAKMCKSEIKVREGVFSEATFNALPAHHRCNAFNMQALRYYELGKMREARYWSVRAILTYPAQLSAYLLLSKALLGKSGIKLVKKGLRRT